MSKGKRHANGKPAVNAQERLEKAAVVPAERNRNINRSHNTTKQSMGPNTER